MRGTEIKLKPPLQPGVGLKMRSWNDPSLVQMRTEMNLKPPLQPIVGLKVQKWGLGTLMVKKNGSTNRGKATVGAFLGFLLLMSNFETWLEKKIAEREAVIFYRPMGPILSVPALRLVSEFKWVKNFEFLTGMRWEKGNLVFLDKSHVGTLTEVVRKTWGWEYLLIWWGKGGFKLMTISWWGKHVAWGRGHNF